MPPVLMRSRQFGYQLQDYGYVVKQLRLCSHSLQGGSSFVDTLYEGLYLLVAFSSARIQAGQLVPLGLT